MHIIATIQGLINLTYCEILLHMTSMVGIMECVDEIAINLIRIKIPHKNEWTGKGTLILWDYLWRNNIHAIALWVGFPYRMCIDLKKPWQFRCMFKIEVEVPV